MRYEIEAPVPPLTIGFEMIGAGEPEQRVAFPVARGSDARFFRAFAFKPTVEGTFDLAMRAYDAAGTLVAETLCPAVTITP